MGLCFYLPTPVHELVRLDVIPHVRNISWTPLDYYGQCVDEKVIAPLMKIKVTCPTLT